MPGRSGLSQCDTVVTIIYIYIYNTVASREALCVSVFVRGFVYPSHCTMSAPIHTCIHILHFRISQVYCAIFTHTEWDLLVERAALLVSESMIHSFVRNYESSDRFGRQTDGNCNVNSWIFCRIVAQRACHKCRTDCQNFNLSLHWFVVGVEQWEVMHFIDSTSSSACEKLW